MTTDLLQPAADLGASTDEAFLDIVCAEDDWLRSEFEAIIGASWPVVPPRPRRGSWPERPRPTPGPRIEARRGISGDDQDPGDRKLSRERSPP